MKNKSIFLTTLFLTFFLISCSSDNTEPVNQAPVAFNLISVTNNDSNVAVTPTFTWNAATDTDGDTITYELILDTNATPTTVIASNLSNTSFVVTERLPLFEIFFWKVIAKDTNGSQTESETFSFTTRNLNIPTTPRTDNAGFSARRSHTSVQFNNKLWVIAGNDGVNKNDVWSSSDGGNTWDEMTSAANFSPPYLHTSVVYDGKIWVFGADGITNDVWNSTDGINWTEVTSSPQFSARYGYSSVIFDNKMWVIGGTDDGDIYKNDVWSSTDGVNWTEATSAAPFAGRSDFGLVVFNNKIWVIGGYDDGSSRNDIWSSSNGTTWTETTVVGDIFSIRSNHTTVTFDNKIWLFGGAYGGERRNDVWNSSDGISWAPVVNSAPRFSGRNSHTTVVFDNKIWLIAGYDGLRKNDVWVFD